MLPLAEAGRVSHGRVLNCHRLLGKSVVAVCMAFQALTGFQELTFHVPKTWTLWCSKVKVASMVGFRAHVAQDFCFHLTTDRTTMQYLKIFSSSECNKETRFSHVFTGTWSYHQPPEIASCEAYKAVAKAPGRAHSCAQSVPLRCLRKEWVSRPPTGNSNGNEHERAAMKTQTRTLCFANQKSILTQPCLCFICSASPMGTRLVG